MLNPIQQLKQYLKEKNITEHDQVNLLNGFVCWVDGQICKHENKVYSLGERVGCRDCGAGDEEIRSGVPRFRREPPTEPPKKQEELPEIEELYIPTLPKFNPKNLMDQYFVENVKKMLEYAEKINQLVKVVNILAKK